MQLQPVTSSNIAAVGYDEEKKTLRVQFLNDTVYDYLRVEKTTFLGLVSAGSVGKYFNTHVKDQYDWMKIA